MCVASGRTCKWGALFAALLLVSFARAAQSQTEDTKTFGDWQIACPPDQACRMAQTIIVKSSKTPVVRLRVFKGKEPVALFSFPLGSLLSTGWRYRIDKSKQQLRPFEICNIDGCHAGIKLNAKLIRRMKRGNRMKVTFFDSKQKPVSPELSLAGFTKAYEALK